MSFTIYKTNWHFVKSFTHRMTDPICIRYIFSIVLESYGVHGVNLIKLLVSSCFAIEGHLLQQG